MRFILLLSAWLGLLGWSSQSRESLAQEIAPTESMYSPIETPTDRVIEFFNTPDQVEHAGLLGKIFIQGRYVDQAVDDQRLGRYDKSRQGYDTLINLPIFTLDTPQPIDFDLFFGYANDGLNGSAKIQRFPGGGNPYRPPASPLPLKLSSEAVTYDIGTSIYLSREEQWRPFVQIGARFVRSDIRIERDIPPGWIEFGYLIGLNDGFFDAYRNYSMHDTRLLLNTGFEFDVFDSLAYRLTLFAETKDQFQDSVVSNDLILWPINRIFLRGGLATELDGGHIGFSIGGGMAF